MNEPGSTGCGKHQLGTSYCPVRTCLELRGGFGWLGICVVVVVVGMWKLMISLLVYCEEDRSEPRYLCLPQGLACTHIDVNRCLLFSSQVTHELPPSSSRDKSMVSFPIV